jgi:hypothetical protein
VVQQLDPFCCHHVLQAGVHMDWCIVPEEPSLLQGHGGLLNLAMFHEFSPEPWWCRWHW